MQETYRNYRRLRMIGTTYQFALIKLRCAYSTNKLSENDINEMSQYKTIVKSVDNALEKIDHVSSMIIKNEFLNNQEPKWWTRIYSQSSFYRYRAKAVKLFLFFIDL